MTRHPEIGSISCSLAILFTLLSPVTGFGFAFDTASCSPQAIAFLTIQFQRAVTTCVNTANVLGQDEVPDDITDPIGFMMNEGEPITDLRAVFVGGQVSNRNGNGQVQQIPGIASYTQVLQSFDSTDPSANNPADTPGNLLIFCNADRLGQASWNQRTNAYNTFDNAGGIYFPQPYRQCGQYTAAFFVHPAPGRADRVTICDWLLNPFVTTWSAGQSYDTRLSINFIRSLAPASASTEDELEQFITRRNAAIQPLNPLLVQRYNAGQMGDIDMSVGFDTWMIYILTQSSAGGRRIDVNSNNQLPTNAWEVSCSIRDVSASLRSLSYMLAAQVVFNYYVGWAVTAWDGKYTELFPRRGDLDFGTDRIPVPLPPTS